MVLLCSFLLDSNHQWCVRWKPDPEDGWQYATDFYKKPERWKATWFKINQFEIIAPKVSELIQRNKKNSDFFTFVFGGLPPPVPLVRPKPLLVCVGSGCGDVLTSLGPRGRSSCHCQTWRCCRSIMSHGHIPRIHDQNLYDSMSIYEFCCKSFWRYPRWTKVGSTVSWCLVGGLALRCACPSWWNSAPLWCRSGNCSAGPVQKMWSSAHRTCKSI